MKKITALSLALILALSCVSCKSQKQVIDLEPQLSQMKAICELAVMDCYYHNVAKYKEDAKGIFPWDKGKHFWIEYSGVVRLGIDASAIALEINETAVTITLPAATVINCTVNSASLTDNSFIVDQGSAKITAEDETIAFAEAQQKMEDSAANDKVLLRNAQQRAQTLLEQYINNIGDAMGKQYTINWLYVDANGNRPDTSVSEPQPEPEPSQTS